MICRKSVWFGHLGMIAPNLRLSMVPVRSILAYEYICVYIYIYMYIFMYIHVCVCITNPKKWNSKKHILK